MRCAGRRDRCPAIARFLLYLGPRCRHAFFRPFAESPVCRSGPPAGRVFRVGRLAETAAPLPSVLYHLLNAASPELRKRDINQTPTKSTILFLVQYLPNHAEVFLYHRNTGPRIAAHPLLADAAPKARGAPRLDPRHASKITLLCDHQICKSPPPALPLLRRPYVRQPSLQYTAGRVRSLSDSRLSGPTVFIPIQLANRGSSPLKFPST